MKQIKPTYAFQLTAYFLICLVLLVGCGPKTQDTSEVYAARNSDTTVKSSQAAAIQYDSLFTSPQPLDKKPYTLLVYMNGSNLESDYKMATNDLVEMCESQFDSEQINLIVLTGGTRQWRNPVMKSDRVMVFSVTPEDIVELEDLGDISIVDSGLLTAFIDYGVRAYPAERFGFLFWDHGGGPMKGYGYDEKFGGKSMSMLELGQGLANSRMAETPFEFIGFDCCLMGNLEIACIIAPYANYMIASSELEPGRGWDYRFLSGLSDNPSMDGGEVGAVIVDQYMAYYQETRQPLTLSVTNLSKIGGLSGAVEDFMGEIGQTILDGDFRTFSNIRKNARTYGKLGIINNFDLVDLKQLALELYESYPEEAGAVTAAFEEAVIYNRSSRGMEDAYGLSIYIPYDCKDTARVFVDLYNRFNIMPGHARFLKEYTERLLEGPEDPYYQRIMPQPVDDSEIYIQIEPEKLKDIADISFTLWRQMEEGSDFFINLGIDRDVQIEDTGRITSEFDGYWYTIAGQPVCLYELNQTEEEQWYSTPAVVNGEEGDILLVFDRENPDGQVAGIVLEGPGDTGVSSKNMLSIQPGDNIAFQYYTQLYLEEGRDGSLYQESHKWVTGRMIQVEEELSLKLEPVGEELYLYGFCIEDIYNNSYYTDFIEIQY